jgi:hypothetical protein
MYTIKKNVTLPAENCHSTGRFKLTFGAKSSKHEFSELFSLRLPPYPVLDITMVNLYKRKNSSQFHTLPSGSDTIHWKDRPGGRYLPMENNKQSSTIAAKEDV